MEGACKSKVCPWHSAEDGDSRNPGRPTSAKAASLIQTLICGAHSSATADVTRAWVIHMDMGMAGHG